MNSVCRYRTKTPFALEAFGNLFNVVCSLEPVFAPCAVKRTAQFTFAMNVRTHTLLRDAPTLECFLGTRVLSSQLADIQ